MDGWMNECRSAEVCKWLPQLVEFWILIGQIRPFSNSSSDCILSENHQFIYSNCACCYNVYCTVSMVTADTGTCVEDVSHSLKLIINRLFLLCHLTNTVFSVKEEGEMSLQYELVISFLTMGKCSGWKSFSKLVRERMFLHMMRTEMPLFCIPQLNTHLNR